MITALVEADAPSGIYRLGRLPDPWAFADWAFAGPDHTFGNRWDDPLGVYRVLYGCSQRVGTFLETLAVFRPDPAVVAGLDGITDDDDRPDDGVQPGDVPIDEWLRVRGIGQATPIGAFADVGHSESLALLRRDLAAQLVTYGLDDLDGHAIRMTAPRSFTQQLSRYVFEHRTVAGQQWTGVAYLSRLGDDIHNWAIFEPGQIEVEAVDPIGRDDVDLVKASELLGLRFV